MKDSADRIESVHNIISISVQRFYLDLDLNNDLPTVFLLRSLHSGAAGKSRDSPFTDTPEHPQTR